MEVSSTFFLLVGISRYKYLEPLPAASGNVHGLIQVLQKKNSVDFKMISDIRRLEKADVFFKELEDIVKNTEYRRLVIYYAGHGIPMDDGAVVFSTFETNPAYLEEGHYIDLERINKILMKSPALEVILILDCCFSERAVNSLRQPSRCILTAADSDSTSLYPIGADYSVFTGRLIEILENGREDYSDLISMENIRKILTEEFPERKTGYSRAGDVADVFLFKNQKTVKETSQENENYIRKILLAVSLYQAQPPMSSLRKMLEFILRKYPYMISYLLKNLFDDKSPVNKEYLFNYYDVLKKFFYYILVAKVIADKRSSTTRGNIELIFDDRYVEKINSLIAIAKRLDQDCLEDSNADKKGEYVSYKKEVEAWESGLRDLFMKLDQRKNDADLSEIKSLLVDTTAKMAFTTAYTFLSVSLIEVQYHNKYMVDAQFEHIACHLSGETLNGYDVTVILDQTEFSLVWKKFFFNKAVIMCESFDRKTKEVEGVVNMWPFMIDQTVYSAKDSTMAKRNLPVFMLLYEKAGKDYMYRGLLDVPQQPKQSYSNLTNTYISSQGIREQFDAFENDLGKPA